MKINYVLLPGECINCALFKECSVNKEGVKSFLAKFKIVCKSGIILGVESE